MQIVRIAVATVNQTPLDWSGNLRRQTTAIADARSQGAQLVCLPELSVTGYGCEDMHFAIGTQQAALEMVDELCEQSDGMIVVAGLPLFVDSSLYNAVAVIVDRKLIGFVLKQHLATDGIHYESRWFRPWPAGRVASVRVGGNDVPAGDLLFDCGGVVIGIEICRDAWVARRVGATLAQHGADILLNPSASHFAFGKQRIRERFVVESSRAFGVTYAYCNLLGNESGRSVYDGGRLISSGGRMIAQGRLFSYQDREVTTADIDIDNARRMRGESFDAGRRTDRCIPQHIHVGFSWQHLSPAKPSPAVAEAWELATDSKQHEFGRAVPLALFDYLRKSRSRGFVVSASGGADSSAVILLVALSIRWGLAELGREQLARRLAYIPAIGELFSTDQDDEQLSRSLTQQLLTCVYQATRQSSATTLAAARAVADTVGAEFLQWSVDNQVDGYVATAGEVLGHELTWEGNDVALQNIQARARGPAAWLVANVRNRLLLATSNRSEAAVGYATMDGDTCGGLAPIAGIDKDFLRNWLKWMEHVGTPVLGPLPSLQLVTSQAPTAELRPASAGQTDEADLMPYDVLDAIERLAIRDKRYPRDAYAHMVSEFPQHPSNQLGRWVIRFYRLWCQNQWKRERYAPSFHVDDESLDPKAWCRFPILNSGFEQELADLAELIGDE